MHQDFFENITKNTMPCISGEEGLKSLALVSAVFESGGSNQPVKVNL
jgi:predicted dehydrogenase